MKKSSLSMKMYSNIPNMIIGFHGCSKKAYDNVMSNGGRLLPSTNDYDWLGNGIYFWEQNLERAWQWAEDKAKRSGDGYEPAVLGAIIDLGYCLNLVDSNKIKLLKKIFPVIRASNAAAGSAFA